MRVEDDDLLRGPAETLHQGVELPQGPQLVESPEAVQHALPQTAVHALVFDEEQIVRVLFVCVRMNTRRPLRCVIHNIGLLSHIASTNTRLT
jgi:hypothetical protein